MSKRSVLMVYGVALVFVGSYLIIAHQYLGRWIVGGGCIFSGIWLLRANSKRIIG